MNRIKKDGVVPQFTLIKGNVFDNCATYIKEGYFDLDLDIEKPKEEPKLPTPTPPEPVPNWMSEETWRLPVSVIFPSDTAPPTLSTVLALVCAAPGVIVTSVLPVVAV